MPDEPLWKPAAVPYKALDQPRPAARKSSLTQDKLTSRAVSFTHILNTVQRKERKSIFIKYNWQEDSPWNTPNRTTKKKILKKARNMIYFDMERRMNGRKVDIH